jgi:hypothetical protein
MQRVRVTAWRWPTWPALFLALAGCGSDGSASSTTATTEATRSVRVAGTEGSDSWTLGMHPDGEGFCLSLSFDPPMRNPIVVGQAASLSAPSASVAGDICLGQPLDARPEAVSFQPVFVPFVYEEPDYRRQVIGGVVSSEARDLQLELASGDAAPIEVRDGGLFIEFPNADVVALRMTLDGATWRCEEGLASAFDLCQPM